jgi:hypothetical protein
VIARHHEEGQRAGEGLKARHNFVSRIERCDTKVSEVSKLVDRTATVIERMIFASRKQSGALKSLPLASGGCNVPDQNNWFDFLALFGFVLPKANNVPRIKFLINAQASNARIANLRRDNARCS